jgi:NADH-quinone oxidoreductase subunit J
VVVNIELVLFFVFAVAILLSAGLVIFSKNPINSAMSLVASFFFLAGIYVLLWAHTIAALQVLVYAGAIMVLFLFVIMLLNLGEAELGSQRLTLSRIAGGLAALGIFAALALAISRAPELAGNMDATRMAGFGTLRTVGQELYTRWLFPFEAVSLLLLVSMVGAVVVSKSKI